MYRIFRIPPARQSLIDALLKDDLVGRQSVVVRDAKSLDVAGEGWIVLVEGSEDGVAQAETILREGADVLRGTEAEHAYARFRAQDEDAASGMGLLFGS